MVDLPTLVASAIESERSSFSAAVPFPTSRTVKRIREILPKKLRLVALTSSAKVSESLGELGIEVKIWKIAIFSRFIGFE